MLAYKLTLKAKLRYRAHTPKIDLSPTFDEITQARKCLSNVLMGPRRTYLPGIIALTFSKAEI